MRQPLKACVFSKTTRPNLPAGQFLAFDTSSSATLTLYWALFEPSAALAGIGAADSLDSGTPAQVTVPFQGRF